MATLIHGLWDFSTFAQEGADLATDVVATQLGPAEPARPATATTATHPVGQPPPGVDAGHVVTRSIRRTSRLRALRPC